MCPGPMMFSTLDFQVNVKVHLEKATGSVNKVSDVYSQSFPCRYKFGRQ